MRRGTRGMDLVGASEALGVPPTDLALHLAHLGVDAPRLGHLLREGDPEGVLDDLAARLERSTAAVTLDLAAAADLVGSGSAWGGWGRAPGFLGVDLAPLAEVLDAGVRATAAGEVTPPPWLVDLLNPFAPHRETALDAWVRRLHRWRRGVAAVGLLVAGSCLSVGAAILLDPTSTGLLVELLPVGLLVAGVATVTAVVLASGFVSARVDRLDRIRGRLGSEPVRLVREAADRVGLDDAVRRAAIRAALRATSRASGDPKEPTEGVPLGQGGAVEARPPA